MSKFERHSDKMDKSQEKPTSSKRSRSDSDSDEGIEIEPVANASSSRESWMSMTGMLKTYTKKALRPKKEAKNKQHIDSYDPSKSGRELNPYWKDGGSGLPQSAEELKKTRSFMKPKSHDDDYYSKRSRDSRASERDSRGDRDSKRSHKSDSRYSKSSWKKESKETREDRRRETPSPPPRKPEKEPPTETVTTTVHSQYLSDEEMNKLAAKMIKAEIMGKTKLHAELSAKLQKAREYREQNPDAGKNEAVMLTTMDSMGNARPLVRSTYDSTSRKRKADTHQSGERLKYFAMDDKHDLSQIFEKEKYGNAFDDEAEFARIASKSKNPNDDLEDIFTAEIAKYRDVSKDDARDKQRAIKQHQKMEKSMDGCAQCIDSKNMIKHLIVSMGSKVYLSLPSRTSLVEGHCIISTMHHAPCSTALDEDVWEEIMDFRKALTKYFNSRNEDVVFFETATRLHKYPHMVINCIPLPRDVGSMAPIYFKKALQDSETEWSMNKKVVDLKGKNIRKGVPKGLPYFWVDFAMEPGFAHVIEDQDLFPKAFAEEILGGVLDLEHTAWKNPKREHAEEQRNKVMEFITQWRKFDTVSNK